MISATLSDLNFDDELNDKNTRQERKDETSRWRAMALSLIEYSGPGLCVEHLLASGNNRGLQNSDEPRYLGLSEPAPLRAM